MAEFLRYLLAFVAGVGLGLFYFGGLWWTVRRIPAVRHPALLSLGSLFARLVVAVGGLYIATGGHWVRLLVSLLAFVLTRKALIRRWGPQRGDPRARARRGVGNAYHA
jgi:F1F0 ATPase subunit 2